MGRRYGEYMSEGTSPQVVPTAAGTGSPWAPIHGPQSPGTVSVCSTGVLPARHDHGLTGTNRARPGLDQALAAMHTGDTPVEPKLDRLARSVPDARGTGDDLAERGITLSLGGQLYDPKGKMFFNILATFAKFEVDLLRLRTREGMAVARAKGRFKGRQPKLSTTQQTALRRMRNTGNYTIIDLAELFGISRPTVYRTIQHGKAKESAT